MFERPSLYFRRRENGAAVYRILDEKSQRLDMQQVAVVKLDGEIKQHGNHELTAEETGEIIAWHAMRLEAQPTREAELVDRLVGDLNAMAQWTQANATDDQVREAAEPLMLAMHDLRATIVRRLGSNKG